MQVRMNAHPAKTEHFKRRGAIYGDQPPNAEDDL